MTAKRIIERVVAPFVGCRVNREAGTIDGVLICGTQSANGRDYPVAVFKRDFAKYEGRPVNCDHAGRCEATVDRRFGWFSDVKPGPDGRPRGRLNCLKSHPMYERVMEAAERNPTLFGFSHVAMCRTRTDRNGREIVEAIESVDSIDLVAEPATTKGLFEGKTVTRTTLRAVIEKYRTCLKEAGSQKAARRLLLLAEDDAATDEMMNAPVDTPDSDATDPDQAIADAFKQAIHAQVDALLDESYTLADFITKIRELYKSRAKLLGKATDPDSDSDTGAEESRRAWARELVRESLTDAERPTSTGRGRITPALTTGERRTESQPPTDPKAFAEWVR
jgi:hypothetical protein